MAAFLCLGADAVVMNWNDFWSKFAWISQYNIDFRLMVLSFKGSLDGFNRGLYDSDHFKLSENCFNVSDE